MPGIGRGRLRHLLAALSLGVPAAVSSAAELEDALAGADLTRGEAAFRICGACHTVEKGGASLVGPNLWGIIGSDVAAHEGFAYSPAMQPYGGKWTPERLYDYLENPREAVPGTTMVFVGIGDETERASVIAHLNRFSDDPLDLGVAPGGTSSSSPAGAEDFGVLVTAPGASKTFYSCTPCHSERIVAQQGLTRGGWDELLDWMVEEQGMAELDADVREVILGYLETEYGPDRPNFSQ